VTFLSPLFLFGLNLWRLTILIVLDSIPSVISAKIVQPDNRQTPATSCLYYIFSFGRWRTRVTIMGSWQEKIKKLGVIAYAGRNLGGLWAGTIKRF
jgi:hypothetical protein